MSATGFQRARREADELKQEPEKPKAKTKTKKQEAKKPKADQGAE